MLPATSLLVFLVGPLAADSGAQFMVSAVCDFVYCPASFSLVFLTMLDKHSNRDLSISSLVTWSPQDVYTHAANCEGTSGGTHRHPTSGWYW